MTILFWPRHDANEQLPNTAGVVVGWFVDKDTVICARILFHKDNEVVKTILRRKRSRDGLQLIGQWDPTMKHGPSPSLHDLKTFVPTSVGPWWSDKEKEDGDLLVYYKPGQVYNVTSDQLVFASILVRLNHVERIIERLKEISASDYKKTEKKPVTKEQGLHEPSFLRRRSLLLNHFSQTSEFERIPLLRFMRVDKTSDVDRSKYAIDFIIGALAFLLIFVYSEALEQGFEFALKSNEELRTGILWLESFPAGFKLNVPLTHNMGRELLLLLEYWHRHVLQSLLGPVDHRMIILQCCALTSLVFGASTLLALLVDAVQVLTLHLALIHAFFSKVHQFQLYMLSSLWKLFRGKKRNPLRQRTDTMEYDSMQLLVGMLAFTFVLFLFTTILVYHIFFATIYALIQPVGLWLLYGVIKEFPFASLWRRWRHPEQVGVGIYLKEESPTTTWLCVVPMAYTSVMENFVARYPGRIIRLGFAGILKIATGERLEMCCEILSRANEPTFASKSKSLC